MVFDEFSTAIALFAFSVPAVVAAYLHFIRDRPKAAVLLLLASAFLLRLLMISLDPYLHEWDERHHALVAKHMMDNPIKPMLFLQHIFPVNKYDVSYTDIWVHKQPVFLWQMALSMKLFGVNLIAMRLPSAIMGTIMVWLTYDLCKKWWQDNNVAFTAALLSCFAYYSLELTSGFMSLDHNDLAFTFYMTCCFWAFTKYVHSDYVLKWAVLIGVFAGLAILNKWLTGLLVFGGWGLYLLIGGKVNVRKCLHFAAAIFITCAIFIPWQIYIMERFPLETSIAYEYNHRHIVEDLGHPGNVWFHFRFLLVAYHIVLIIFLLIGMITALLGKEGNKKLTIAFLAMIFVIFSFFSIFVATKMPAFVYPVSSLLFGFMAAGITRTSTGLLQTRKPLLSYSALLFFIFALTGGLFSLKPWKVAQERSPENTFRNNKIHNNAIFRQVNVSNDYVILNTRAYENLELMFFQDDLAYHWYPDENTLDSLQNVGYKFAVFQYQNDQQQLPPYIVNDKEIIILPHEPK